MRRSLFSRSVLRSPRQIHQPPIAQGAIGSRALYWNAAGGQQDVQVDELRPSHDADNAYPARAGDKIGGKYQLLFRLGCGRNSTVWLATKVSTRALRGQRYVTLKIGDSSTSMTTAQQELQDFNRYHATWSSASRQTYVSKAIKSSGVEGPGGTYPCTAFEHVHKPHWILGRHLSVGGLTHSHILKGLIPSVLRCLDFLHTTCHAVHTDNQGHHFMLPADDSDLLRALSRKVRSEHLGHRGDYSQTCISRVRKDVKLTILREFDPAKDLRYEHGQNGMSGAYVSPEVLLKTGSSYPADIWNLGLLLWNVVAGTDLLDGTFPADTELSDLTLFAQMVRLLGLPPPELLEAVDKEVLARFFDVRGTFKYPELIPGEAWNLSSKMTMLEGEDKALFISFVKRMLSWTPNERSTARELLHDPWLKL